MKLLNFIYPLVRLFFVEAPLLYSGRGDSFIYSCRLLAQILKELRPLHFILSHIKKFSQIISIENPFVASVAIWVGMGLADCVTAEARALEIFLPSRLTLQKVI